MTTRTRSTRSTTSDHDDDEMRRMISLEELLSSCIDASLQGCHVIRQYKHDNATICGILKEAGDIKSVMTQADLDAQHVIIHGLRRTWGTKLTIVGEEEDDDDNSSTPTRAAAARSSNVVPLRTQLLQGTTIVPTSSSTTCCWRTQHVPLQEITIFVDPLDGTREFVEGRLQNVGCLVGVARRGKAIMGAVGLPFPTSSSSLSLSLFEPKILYAIHMDEQHSHHGTYPMDTTDNNNDNDDNTYLPTPPHDDTMFTLFTGDSKDPVLKNATALAMKILASAATTSQTPTPTTQQHQQVNHIILGGTTSKFVAVAQTKTKSLAILHAKTCSWDTCAPEPLLNAMGGKVTDLFGSPLVHRKDQRYNYGNVWGVIASSQGMQDIHDALCAGMRADRESVQRTLGPLCMGIIPSDEAIAPHGSAAQAQAVDISRDLEGYPLTCSWLQELLMRQYHHREQQNDNNNNKACWSLTGYGVPESDAVREIRSNGARLVLNWKSTTNNKDEEEEANNGKPPPPPPSSIFYKRVVMSDLSHARSKFVTAPHKGELD
jgi:3'-phosphoadenosine 5'-phosphosulfate (PAPS) 3'-phosphatase